jgi:hypothetical protein
MKNKNKEKDKDDPYRTYLQQSQIKESPEV